MIIIVSNREVVNEGAKDETIFGGDMGVRPDELRLAEAKYESAKDKWRVNLIEERDADMSAGNPPSRQLFEDILQKTRSGKISKDWVFFVHGFNQSFEKNLRKCHALEKIYNVNVIAFSWPSNPGGLSKTEYKRARANARASVAALDRTLEKLSTYMRDIEFDPDCDVHLNFLSYSLGNYLFEQVVRSPVHYNGETRMFENIVLCQADVDSETHGEWVSKLKFGRRVYATINEDDKTLDTSDIINPDRLGNTAANLNVPGVVYFDFTDGKNVGKTHGVFYAFNYPDLKFKKDRKRNPTITAIFQRALTGRRAENVDGITFN